MKKLLVMVLALVMVLSFSVTAFASNDVSDKFIGEANTKVEAYMQNVTVDDISEKDYAKVDMMVEKANQKILKMVNKAMSANNLDIDKLVEKTNAVAFKEIEKASKLGIEVLCEYVAYEIQGHTIYIDPLRVVRR
ncbi:MAG: hypothetical protein PHE51_07590 [Eubacteriales bacterium]|nr:hypothetical protein [Eubacteriales bacterium]